MNKYVIKPANGGVSQSNSYLEVAKSAPWINHLEGSMSGSRSSLILRRRKVES